MKTNNEEVLKYMYRYLEKYTGTYRVLPELYKDELFPKDENGKIEKSFEDLYIPCKKGVIKHTYIDFDILCICFYDSHSAAKNTYKEIKHKYPDLELRFEDDGRDGYIYFNANDIKKIATIIKPRTSGATIKWDSNKNLPKVVYTIPNEDLEKYNKITGHLTQTEKMQLCRKINSSFLDSITTKRYNAKEELKESRLGPKEFIHSIGKWNDYLKYYKKQLKEQGK